MLKLKRKVRLKDRGKQRSLALNPDKDRDRVVRSLRRYLDRSLINLVHLCDLRHPSTAPHRHPSSLLCLHLYLEYRCLDQCLDQCLDRCLDRALPPCKCHNQCRCPYDHQVKCQMSNPQRPWPLSLSHSTFNPRLPVHLPHLLLPLNRYTPVEEDLRRMPKSQHPSTPRRKGTGKVQARRSGNSRTNLLLARLR